MCLLGEHLYIIIMHIYKAPKPGNPVLRCCTIYIYIYIYIYITMLSFRNTKKHQGPISEKLQINLKVNSSSHHHIYRRRWNQKKIYPGLTMMLYLGLMQKTEHLIYYAFNYYCLMVLIFNLLACPAKLYTNSDVKS